MPRANLPVNGDNIYTEKVKRIQKLTQETETKIDGIPGVVNDATSTSTTDALSANMGKVLQDQINELKSMGRFLSTWDCSTGLPTTDPIDDPYDYRIWDYYIVSVVWSWTKYRPHWAQYVAWVPSTDVETAIVNINDWYLYDGQVWILQNQNQITITVDTQLSTTSTNAVENRAIANAINTKQNIITDLNTIRSGASLWATALQPGDNISELVNNSWYQTAWDVATAISWKADAWSLATVATTGDFNDLINIPAPATVNDNKITINKNGAKVDDFTLNQNSDKTINITVPTKTSDLANDSGFVPASGLPTKVSDLINDAWYITSAYVWNGQISIKQGASNKGSFTLNQSWAATIPLELTTIMSETDYIALQNKDPNTTYIITDWAPADPSGWIQYVTVDVVNQLSEQIIQLQNQLSSVVSDAALSPSWDWVTWIAPSKNATYDAIWNVETLLANL